MDAEKLLEVKKEKFNAGVAVFIFLATLTIGEFSIAAVGQNLAVILMLVALLKASLVVRDYMHIGRLFTSEEE